MGDLKHEPYQVASILWLKMTSLAYFNFFSVDTEAAVGVVLWRKCFHRKTPTLGSLSR